MVEAWFDGILNIRRNDRVRLIKGTEENDGRIRVSVLENLTSGIKQISRINGILMGRPPEELDPLIEGRVIKGEIHSSDPTKLTLALGVYTDDHVFIEAGNPQIANNVLQNIFSSQLSNYVKICDPYINDDTIRLFNNVPNQISIQLLYHTISPSNSRANVISEIQNLRGNGKSIDVKFTDRSSIHSRYIITDGYGWVIDHSLKDLGTKDVNILSLTSTDNLPSLETTYLARWNAAQNLI